MTLHPFVRVSNSTLPSSESVASAISQVSKKLESSKWRNSARLDPGTNFGALEQLKHLLPKALDSAKATVDDLEEFQNSEDYIPMELGSHLDGCKDLLKEILGQIDSFHAEADRGGYRSIPTYAEYVGFGDMIAQLSTVPVGTRALIPVYKARGSLCGAWVDSMEQATEERYLPATLSDYNFHHTFRGRRSLPTIDCPLNASNLIKPRFSGDASRRTSRSREHRLPVLWLPLNLSNRIGAKRAQWPDVCVSCYCGSAISARYLASLQDAKYGVHSTWWETTKSSSTARNMWRVGDRGRLAPLFPQPVLPGSHASKIYRIRCSGTKPCPLPSSPRPGRTDSSQEMANPLDLRGSSVKGSNMDHADA
ncbi:hypothetical protein L228DRAFT_268019 [Xylona heveae TC161]|uniref:Uncharacterized protein n=1 Tax=Xylona heveae (strain CBS 132557 / TC161) TaxID=1328760 RepID=A0A165GV19_XYLHT|nr:hypothetical protein L228DRAFT_268019 [Xylona heveae TC161]KZF22630.1 hypothetical protein L228DRAFT_268019 [Xylona heveae TC161]